jgi:hypothetical protein
VSRVFGLVDLCVNCIPCRETTGKRTLQESVRSATIVIASTWTAWLDRKFCQDLVISYCLIQCPCRKMYDLLLRNGTIVDGTGKLELERSCTRTDQMHDID